MGSRKIKFYGEILAAAGVIPSLGFVDWQITANTKAARLPMHEQLTQTCMSFPGSMLVDPESFDAGLNSEPPDFS